MKLSKEIKLLMKQATIICFIIIIYGLIIRKPEVYIGLTLGCVGSILSLYHMVFIAHIAIANGKRAARINFFGYLQRYLFYGAMLVIMMNIGYNYFLGAALGLLLIKFLIYINQIIKGLQKFLKKINI